MIDPIEVAAGTDPQLVLLVAGIRIPVGEFKESGKCFFVNGRQLWPGSDEPCQVRFNFDAWTTIWTTIGFGVPEVFCYYRVVNNEPQNLFRY